MYFCAIQLTSRDNSSTRLAGRPPKDKRGTETAPAQNNLLPGLFEIQTHKRLKKKFKKKKNERKKAIYYDKTQHANFPG